MTEPSCEVCGRAPAIHIYASMYSGRILLGDELFWKGDACRQCATCQYRAGLAHCLWAGWWAPVALVVNPRMIWRNAKGLREAKRMPEPVGVPLAEPLDPGRPVFRRPAAVVGMLIPLVVVGAIVALVLAVTGTRRIDELAAGDCLDLPVGRTIERADPIDCDDPHNAEVTGVIAAGKVPSLGDLCARQTTAYLGSDEGVDGLQPAAIRYGVDGKTSVICLVTSDDGSRFSGSRRGAGR